jgi:hypothetical protein
MKYAPKMGAHAMIYVRNITMIGSGIQKLIGGDSQTYRQHEDRISLLWVLKIIKVGQYTVK